MAKKRWTIERKWELSRQETEFVKLLENNGYEIKGLREYQSKTDYLISKYDVEYEYSFPLTGSVNVKKFFEMFEDSFRMYKELKELRKLV